MSQPTFQVEDVTMKGKGVVAHTDIKAGTLILSEPPLFTLPRHVQRPSAVQPIIAKHLHVLTKEQQREFFSLQNSYPNLPPLEGIFKTNAIPLGVNATEGGLFLRCSRFNHSCLSNAAYSWNSKLSAETVYAVKDIKKGEEINVNYFSAQLWANPKVQRQALLLDEFGFTCCCQACNRPPPEVAASDERRQNIAVMDASLGDGILIVANPCRALRYCQEILRLFDEESETGPMVFSTYYDAFQVCVAHSDYARARSFAQLAAKWQIFCQGADAEDIENVQKYIQEPEHHPSAGMTTRWKMNVKRIPKLEGGSFERWLWQNAG